MSVDATPSLVAGLVRLPPDQAAAVSQRICQRRQIHTSIVNWSLAEHRGQEAGPGLLIRADEPLHHRQAGASPAGAVVHKPLPRGKRDVGNRRKLTQQLLMVLLVEGWCRATG